MSLRNGGRTGIRGTGAVGVQRGLRGSGEMWWPRRGGRRPEDKLRRQRKDAGPKSGGVEVREPLRNGGDRRLLRSSDHTEGCLFGTVEEQYEAPGRRGHARAPRSGRTSEAGGLENTGDVSGDAVTCRGSEGQGCLQETGGSREFFADTWPHTGTLKGGVFVQKLGHHMPLEVKTETSTRVLLSPGSE